MAERLADTNTNPAKHSSYRLTDSGLLVPPSLPSADSNGHSHSYEAFTNRAFYVAMDKATIKLAPRASKVMDVAAGVGAMTKLYLEAGKLPFDGMLVAVDIDKTAVEAMKQKFANDPRIEVEEGPAEKLPAKDNSVDLVIIGNAIHLTDVPSTLAEAYRVLAPGGTLVVSSAYTKDHAYPLDGSGLWKRLAVGAIRNVKDQGFKPEHPKDYLNYDVADYMSMMEEAGFSEVSKPLLPVAMMDRKDVIAICEYNDFAEGSLPGVPTEIAIEALTKSAVDQFNRLEETETPPYFPRGWMLVKATK